MPVDSGIIILKYYPYISKKEQQKRLNSHKTDPLKQWKISSIDKVAQKYWKEYSKVRNEMLSRTNFKHAPWFIINADDKKNTHLAVMAHLLNRLDYHKKEKKLLRSDSHLVYPATVENIKKLY